MTTITPLSALTAQERFEAMYITSSDICKELDVSRATILSARRRGLLPEPIMVNSTHLFIWEREPVRQYIDAWKLVLNVRRSNA